MPIEQSNYTNSLTINLLNLPTITSVRGNPLFHLIDINNNIIYSLPATFTPLNSTPAKNIKGNNVPGSSRIFYTGDGLSIDAGIYTLGETLDFLGNGILSSIENHLDLIENLNTLISNSTKLRFIYGNIDIYLDINTNSYKRGFVTRETVSGKPWLSYIKINIFVKNCNWKRTSDNQIIGTIL